MSVFSDLKPKNHVSRNGFDISRRSVFSIKNGQILPVFCQYTLPNSDYRIDVQQLLRTQPLQTAAFTGFSINYDFAFVPFNQLYSSFNQFIGQREDKFLANQPSNTKIPVINLDTYIRNNFQSIFYDFFVSQFTDDWSTAVNGIDTLPYRYYKLNYSDTSFVVDLIRLLDMYGYCNLLPWLKDFQNAFLPYVGMEDGVLTWENFIVGIRQIDPQSPSLYDNYLSAVGDLLSFADSGERPYFKLPILGTFNIFPVLAYNKMFYEYYRNKYYDNDVKFSVWNFDAYRDYVFTYNQLFNLDDFNTSTSYPSERVFSIFALHLHAYRKDLFTGVLPSMQFGDVSMMLANDLGDRQSRYVLDVKRRNDPSSIPNPVRTDVEGRLYSDSLIGEASANVDFSINPNIAISVLESRRADAMQRFRERMLRAGDSTKSIFEAHGWERPKSEQFHEPIFLGSFDGRLDINTVAATNANGDVELGQLGANGVGVVQGHEIKFHSSDFGVILGVMYIVKDSEYNAFGTDRQLCLTEAFDFPYPEFQNISLQPIVYRQLQALKYNTLQYKAEGRTYTPLDQNSILGYLPGYMEYKTAIDKVHGEFCAGEYAWFADPENEYNELTPAVFSGVFSDWVTPRSSILKPDTLSFLYQQKNIVDNIFRVAQTDHQDTDPFLVNAYFKCLAVEPLSVIGLPV